jgi:hypothetical protein
MPALFDEILFDTDIIVAGGATGGPEYANTIVKNPATGIYKVNVNRYDFQQVWNISTELLTPAQLAYFMEFWGGGFGSAYGFRVVVVSDFYVIDEVLGTGNGVQTVFPLIKNYSRPGASHNYSRRIIKPVVNALLGGGGVTLYEPNGTTTRAIPTVRGAPFVPAFTVKKNGSTVVNYTVDNTVGKITFSVAPPAGHVVTWSGEFDTPMRFMTNSFALKPDVSSDIQGIQLCEILPAELGIT